MVTNGIESCAMNQSQPCDEDMSEIRFTSDGRRENSPLSPGDCPSIWSSSGLHEAETVRAWQCVLATVRQRHCLDDGSTDGTAQALFGWTDRSAQRENRGKAGSHCEDSTTPFPWSHRCGDARCGRTALPEEIPIRERFSSRSKRVLVGARRRISGKPQSGVTSRIGSRTFGLVGQRGNGSKTASQDFVCIPYVC